MKRYTALLLTICCLLVAVFPARAQPTLVPDDARFALVLNPSRVMQSQLGEVILDRIRAEEPQIDSMIDEFSNTVGINLRTAVGQTILFGAGYDKRNFALVADIGPSSGNLNGLMLAAPEYQSSVYRDTVIIHSMLTQDPTGGADRLYCALPKRSDGDSYYLVASFDPQRTRDMVDQTMDANARLLADGSDESVLLEVWFNGLPELAHAAQAEGPPSAVAELIQSGHLSLREAGDTGTVSLKLSMTDALRAQQVFELMRGGLAMLQLAASAEPDAQPLAELGRMINVEYAPSQTDVTATLSCNYGELENLLQRLEAMGHGNHNHETAPATTIEAAEPTETQQPQ